MRAGIDFLVVYDDSTKKQDCSRANYRRETLIGFEDVILDATSRRHSRMYPIFFLKRGRVTWLGYRLVGLGSLAPVGDDENDGPPGRPGLALADLPSPDQVDEMSSGSLTRCVPATWSWSRCPR